MGHGEKARISARQNERSSARRAGVSCRSGTVVLDFGSPSGGGGAVVSARDGFSVGGITEGLFSSGSATALRPRRGGGSAKPDPQEDTARRRIAKQRFIGALPAAGWC